MTTNKTKPQLSQQMIKRSLQGISDKFGFSPKIISGFEQLNRKLSLSNLSANEQEIFFINFFRAVYSRLLKKFNLQADWSEDIVVPAPVKQQLAHIPDIHRHYFGAVETLQQDILTNS